MKIIKIVGLLAGVGLSCLASAWTNHTLISQQLAQSIPQLAQAQPVKVESLQSFIMANESELVAFLAAEEAWMASNLWHYNPRPESLRFTATGNAGDAVTRFTHALRINPNAKFALYLQGLPGAQPSRVAMPAKDISVFNEVGHLSTLPLTALTAGERVSPIDVMVSANDEPDHGHDIGLFTDSGTKHGQVYGFGKQPFGNPNLEYGTQAPFHMGFYHESSIIYALAGFLKETYPQMRIHQYKRLAEFAFARGHDYWGYRFMGWGLHYIGDFSNPYHVTPVPGNGVLNTIWLGILGVLGFPEYQKAAVQLVSNRHTVIEDYQSVIMTKAYQQGKTHHQTIQALNVQWPVEPYELSHVIDVFSQRSMDKADNIHKVILASFPFDYVQNSEVEYAELNAAHNIEQTVHNHAGEQGQTQLTHSISDLLGDFAQHGGAYITTILKAKP